MTQANKNKNPKHNKLKLNYGKGGFIYLEHQESSRIIKILKYLQKREGFISMKDMRKDLKISRTSLALALRTMAGVTSVDMNRDGRNERLCGRLIQIKKGMFSSKRNLPRVPPYFKPSIYASRATA